MSPTVDDHVALWRTFAEHLKRGTPLVAALDHARPKLEGTGLERLVQALRSEIEGGSTLSEAMASHEDFFSRCVTTMVRAGEAGGVLQILAERIAEGLQDRSFPLPRTAVDEDDPVRFWQAFGRLLSSGVPILEVLDLIAEEVAGPGLREAAQAMRQAVLDGKDLAPAMEQFPDLFPEKVRLAVSVGESTGELDLRAFQIAGAVRAGDLDSLCPELVDLEAMPDDDKGQTVKLLNLILIQAIKDKASDIHFEPFEDAFKVRCRVDGVLYEMQPPPRELAARIVTRIKVMASMDIAERRLPQDGRIQTVMDGRPYDLRVSSVPVMHGERIVLRILDREAVVLDLERLGLLDDDLAAVRELCYLPNGIVVVNGPTGSGKTTLLYSMLHEIDRDKCCVMSAEDPVEYRLDGVAQIQVNARRGLGFARILRSILRQDPDVIMLGEIRDLETLQIAVQCALTGHLLMTTLHANTSPGAIKRLLDMGLEPFLVNGSLAAVVTQRLVRVLCPECKEAAEPPLHSIPPQAAEFVRAAGPARFFAAKGCEACHGTGYRGRTAIHEILIPDERVRRAVAASADLAGIRDAALAAGMRPMLANGLAKAARGITSIQEVCRVAPHGPND